MKETGEYHGNAVNNRADTRLSFASLCSSRSIRARAEIIRLIELGMVTFS